jgi:hypothetical protein
VLYTLRVLRTAPPVHSALQSICYIYIIITTSCWCCKCYTRFALCASLAAASYHIISYHTRTYTYAAPTDSNRITAVANIYPAQYLNHTCISQPKRQIFFLRSQIKLGAGSFQSHFRWGSTVLKCIYNPLLTYLSYTFFSVTYIFVIQFFLKRTLLYTKRLTMHII